MVRFKNRYFVCEVEALDAAGRAQLAACSAKDVFAGVRGVIGRVLGDFGAGCVLSSLNVKYWNAATGTAIVRCARDHHVEVAGVLERVDSVSGVSVRMRTLYCGGTIRTCQLALVEYQRRIVQQQIATASVSQAERLATQFAALSAELAALL